MNYILTVDIPYEGTIELDRGSLQDLKRTLRSLKGQYPLDDMALSLETHVDIYSLAQEAYGEV